MTGNILTSLGGLVIILIAVDGVSDIYMIGKPITKFFTALVWTIMLIMGSGIFLFPVLRILCLNY